MPHRCPQPMLTYAGYATWCYTSQCMLLMHLHDSICHVVSLQAAESLMAAPEAGGEGLSRGGLAAIIVVACVVGLSLLAAAALVVRRRQVHSLAGALRPLLTRSRGSQGPKQPCAQLD